MNTPEGPVLPDLIADARHIADRMRKYGGEVYDWAKYFDQHADALAAMNAQGKADTFPIYTMINHEKEPHCCGCYNIELNNGDLLAKCNECGYEVCLLELLLQGKAEGGDGGLQFSLGEAKALVEFFGGDNASVSVAEFQARQDTDEGLSEAGKYAWCTDFPEEGCMYLGSHDIDTEEHNELAHPAKAVDAYMDAVFDGNAVWDEIPETERKLVPTPAGVSAVLDAVARIAKRAALATNAGSTGAGN
jgi:hypothetical protein